ncbi:MAG TPA: 6-carboxytetrahydropterin synthase [Tepidisphaeraceae bacterium]
MFRLTREVRFAVNAGESAAMAQGRPSNSYAGYPSLRGAGQFFVLRCTVAGELNAASQYLLNIKEIDEAVRRQAVPLVAGALAERAFGGGGNVLGRVFEVLSSGFQPRQTGMSAPPQTGISAPPQTDKNVCPTRLERVQLFLSPFLSLGIEHQEPAMVKLNQKFEFSASHRLHNPKMSEEENRRTFGKCNNPHGHGHNYEVQVTVAGRPDGNGVIVDVPELERIVGATVIDKLDHKNLNVEVDAFRELIPTVENIAMVIYRMLKARLPALAAVTVWETPKTWCEYSES